MQPYVDPSAAVDMIALSSGLLVVRLVLGLYMVAHGAQKMFGWFGGHGLAGTSQFFAQLGFRPARLFVVAAALTELASGILVTLGLLGPVGPALMLSVLIVAPALGALVVLVVSSILRDRLPWPYEAWRLSHILLALVAVIGGLHHAVTVGRFSMHGLLNIYWLALGVGVVAVILVLHGWRWWKLHRQPWRLESVTKRADRMWELDIQPEPKTPPRHYHAGQFVWMTEGSRRAPIFDHPFSIADSPKRPGLSLIIKEAGDFTRTIGSIPPGTLIGIDGPYGEFTLEAHDCDSILLLAGGVGIAPIMGLLRDLAESGDQRPVRLAYAAGTPDNFACLEEIEAAKSRLDLRAMLVSEEDGPGWPGAVGRLDRDRLDQLLEGLERKRTVAFICGPGPMVTGVSDTLLDLGLPMNNIIYERFDYGGAAASRQDRRRTLGFISIGAGLAAATLVFVAVA